MIEDTYPFVPMNSVIAQAMSLTVMDSQKGIPQKVVDKIFQPAFTTKATGD
ncbi:MAG TPA: hypothetical protein VKR53_10220 [Puia sp.]|nr:hypothetical protein [Puia sp.]